MGYTSSFHLVDSFLSLHGIFFVPFPIQKLEWNTFRRSRDTRASGARIERLEAKRLRSLDSEPISCVLATLDPRANTWEFSVVARHSAHKLKWASYGDVVIQLIKGGGVGSIPRETADFFGYFAPHLAYLDETKDNERRTVAGLKNLIRFACLEFRLYGRKLPSGIPDMRSLAIYKNRSIDDYMRLIGPSLDAGLIGPLPKWAGALFYRHSVGLAKHLAKELASIIEALKSGLATEPGVFENGLMSSMLMANLVELDFDKIVNSDVFNTIPLEVRDILKKVYGKSRYIPITQKIAGWNVGDKDNPWFHILRYPITVGPCVTPNSGWPQIAIDN